MIKLAIGFILGITVVAATAQQRDFSGNPIQLDNTGTLTPLRAFVRAGGVKPDGTDKEIRMDQEGRVIAKCE